MDKVHIYVGFAVVAVFFVFWVWGAIARAMKKLEPGKGFWALLAVVQVVIGLQALIGITLLIMGRMPTDWLHFVYGFGPIVCLVLAHLYVRKETPKYRYVPFVFAGLIAWGLAVRALMTGLGIGG